MHNDADIFAADLEACREPLTKFLRRYMPGRDEVFDVVQETILRAWRFRDQYRSDSSLRCWVFSIGKNAMLSWNIHEGRHTDRRAANDSLDSVRGPDVVKEFLSAENVRYILRSLPVTQRKVATLYYQEGLTGLEISIVLNMNLVTVRTRLMRARKIMLKYFESEDWLSGRERA